MTLKRKCLAGFLAFALCFGLTPAFVVSAYAKEEKPSQPGGSSSNYEYIDITVKAADGTLLTSFYDSGSEGNHTWLVEGTYNTTFTANGSAIAYKIGNQKGSISVSGLPEGWNIKTISDYGSINSLNEQFDCYVGTIIIKTITNPSTGEEVDYTNYGATVRYKDIDSESEIAEAVVIEEYGLAGSSYDLNEYDAISIEGYDYVKTDGDSLSGTLTKDVEVTVWYKRATGDEEEVAPPADEGDEGEDGTTEDDDEGVVEAEEEAEEAEETDTVLPQTGDSTPVALGLLGMAAAAVVAFASRFKMTAA